MGQQVYRLEDYARCFVFGAGKACAPMAQALSQILGDRITDGLIIVKSGHALEPLPRIKQRVAGHPDPDARTLAASAELMAMAQQVGPDDLVIVLLSGGGSSLFELPRQGISLAQLIALNQALVGSGQPIEVINAIRARYSAVKSGGLARSISPAQVITLALSDVIGQPPSVIASGPTSLVPAQDEALIKRVITSIYTPEQRALLGDAPRDAPINIAPITVIGSAKEAAQAAHDAACALGLQATIIDDALVGEAALLAPRLLERALAEPLGPPKLLIWAGEPTVSLGERAGRGGRNQELALAALCALTRGPEASRSVAFASLGTDGTDGPTDVAGAIITSAMRDQRQAAAWQRALAEHDAYPTLEALGALVKTGPTRTNVNDLILVFVV